jgi:hypothetical protein
MGIKPIGIKPIPVPVPDPIPEPIEELPLCPNCNQEMIEEDLISGNLTGKIWYCENKGHTFTYILSYSRGG